MDTWYRFFRRPPDRPLEILEGLELFFKTLDFDAADLSLFGAKIMPPVAQIRRAAGKVRFAA